ncbi:MAG TPA: dUTP diphosphatase [Bacillota bacterium]|nr:dUTP diphosphatase [Bacillota bacterium]
MDWNNLYRMQKELDAYIVEHHHLDKQDVFSKKLLALLVELGEMANETRCFKFWSTKPPSEKNVILEEYVDVLHFMLSIGIDTGFRYHPKNDIKQESEKNITSQFLDLFQICTNFGRQPNGETYTNMFEAYLMLGNALDFQEDDIERMYLEKNNTNYKRQDDGY